MSENIETLMGMGFSEEKCKKALEVNQNLNEALEWLLVHGNSVESAQPAASSKPVESASPTVEADSKNTLKLSALPDENKETPSGGETEQTESSDNASLEANSLKCDDCGVLLKNEDAATLHAHKTGHVNFSQSTESIKPKTKEEIEAQKKRLEERLAKIRQEKQEKERADAIEQEKARRKQGRQINELKQKFHEDELKRIAEEKRREKLADAAYKQKIKDQIAKDREAQKKSKETDQASNTIPAPAPAPAQPSQPAEKKSYDECKIQIRQTDGKTIVQTFRANEQLAAVRLWVEMNRTDGEGKFNLMQTFPRKIFNEDDMMMTLSQLGLVPATSLVISKA